MHWLFLKKGDAIQTSELTRQFPVTISGFSSHFQHWLVTKIVFSDPQFPDKFFRLALIRTAIGDLRKNSYFYFVSESINATINWNYIITFNGRTQVGHY